MKKALLFTILWSLCVVSWAQSKYTVLAKSGDVSYNNAAVNIGQVIKDDQSIVLKPGAYLGLIHESGKPLELKSPGIYAAKELSDLVGSSEGTFSDQFTSFMAREMQENGGSYKSGLGVTGSVERGIESKKIFIPLPKRSKFVGKEMFVHWLVEESDSLSPNYSVEIMSMAEEVIYRKDVQGNECSFDPYALEELEAEELYLLQISNTDSPYKSNVVCFYLPSQEENQELSKEMEALLNTKTSTLESLAAAKFLNEKGYSLAAVNKYQEAIKLDSGVSAKESFEAYIKALK